MEKGKPHYTLSEVKKLILNGQYDVIKTALLNAGLEFGFVKSDIVKVVLNLLATDFYKSMTVYGDSKTWQDVYCPMIDGRQAYIKLNIVAAHSVIIQFKKR